MSLDRTKLQKVRDLGSGGLQAQCPACAETGQDRKGEHLRISPEGKFGCCVFPGDREHRRRIFALAGQHEPKAISVRVAAVKTGAAVQLDLLGRLGRVFATPTEGQVSDSVNLGTLGTPAYSLREDKKENCIRKLVEYRTSVPSVPEVEVCEQSQTGVPSVPREKQIQLPHLLSDGTLVIPFDSPERYHWWTGGQSVKETLKEVQLREMEVKNGAMF